MPKIPARDNILKIKPYKPGKPIEEVRRELGVRDVAKMASNENALGPSPKAAAAAMKAVKKVNRYPDGASFYLKRKLSDKLAVKPENLVVGNGSDELIVLATKAFVDRGDEVIIAKPTFLIYEIASKISGARIKFVPLKDFRYDLEKIKKNVSPATKLIFIANPDNPTGSYVTKKEMERFFRGLRKDVVVFLDEAYFEFAASKRDFPDGMDFLKRGNVIVARTFSKAYGLSGLRVGYGISSRGVIECLNRVREPFNVNSVAQEAALAALDDGAFLKKTVKFTEREKEIICERLKRMGLDYIESATNFILINVKTDSTRVFKKLLRKGIIVRDMSAWGFKTYIRVTVGTQKQNIRFLKSLKEILE
jgi:histidinol-phosphate aminotransferase